MSKHRLETFFAYPISIKFFLQLEINDGEVKIKLENGRSTPGCLTVQFAIHRFY